MQPQIKSFYHAPTFTFTYVVHDGQNPECAVIDPVLDFDNKSGNTSTESADTVIQWLESQGLKLKWILETHAHADHITAAKYFQQQCGGDIAIGDHIHLVQGVFKTVFNYGEEFIADGQQFDLTLGDNSTLALGGMQIQIMHTPGHTPACISYKVGDNIFVGDTLFMPDTGTARCDFPGGDAATLYDSIHKLLSFPDKTHLYMCHDYPDGRDIREVCTVAEQKADNIHIGRGTSKADFIAMREQRDSTLDMPALILPSIQINIRAGLLPEAEDNGVSYLKLPLNQF